MARKQQDEKLIVNNFVVCGEVLDVFNYREYNVGKENECFGYTLKIETDPETKESLDVEYFVNSNSKMAAGLGTIYEEVKTRATHGEGEIVRCTGKVTNNIFCSDGKIVEKLTLSGAFCNRKSDPKNKKMDFTPSAKFDTVGYIREIEGENITALVNEYVGKSIKGHILNFEIGDTAKGFEKATKVGNISFLSGKIKSVTETMFLPEEETEAIDTEGYFGTELEKIEKINETRAKLREEGIKVNKVHLVITGGRTKVKDEQIVDQKVPFLENDIDDMLYNIDVVIKELEQKNNITSDDIPF